MKTLTLSLLISLSSLLVCAQQEDVLYSFQTRGHKVVQLLLTSDSIFKYRLLNRGKVELEVVDDLKDRDTIFTVYGYHRGGGVKNAAMDYNDVRFSNKGYDYDIYYVWSVNEENLDVESEGIYGVSVSKDGVDVADLKGRKVLTGEVYGWSFYEILPKGKQ